MVFTPPTYEPAGRTLANIRSTAASFLQVSEIDSEIDGLVDRAVNGAISKINRHTWKKLWTFEDLTLAADDDSYALSNDFKEPICCLKLDSSSRRDGRIEFKPFQALLMEHPFSTTQSSPRYYSINYSIMELVLDYKPTSGFVTKTPKLRIYYHRRVPYLSGDSDTTTLPPEFDDWVELFAAERLARIREPEKANYLRGVQAEAWRELRTDDNETMTDWSEQYMQGYW